MLPVMDTNRQLESVGVSRHELGVKTNCDAYVYDFTREDLIKKVRRLIDSFNGTLEQYLKHPTRDMVDLVTANDRLDEIQWTHALKSALRRRAKAGVPMTFDESRIREVLYRPFTKVWLYEDWDILAQGKKTAKFFPPESAHTHTHTHSRCRTHSPTPVWYRRDRPSLRPLRHWTPSASRPKTTLMTSGDQMLTTKDLCGPTTVRSLRQSRGTNPEL